jgi:hypothetical protein
LTTIISEIYKNIHTLSTLHDTGIISTSLFPNYPVSVNAPLQTALISKQPSKIISPSHNIMCIAFEKKEAPSLPTPINDHHNKTSQDLMTSSSTHSTTSASTDSNDSMHSLGPSAKTPTKSQVCFQDAAPKIISTMKPSSVMTSDERSQSFWQLHDYEYFRGTARIIATEVLRLSATQPKSGHGYETVLTRAHQVCSSQDDDVCLPPNLFAALAHWTKAGHSRRGLEKFCIPHHMQVRPLERQAVIQAVLIAQDRLKERRQQVARKDGTFVLGTWEFSLDLQDEEILSMVSERFTQTSRKYAITMGHADAAAVGNYEYANI